MTSQRSGAGGGMRISIVVRALNEQAHIGALFDALERQTVRPDEVILVDSGSTDDTVTIAERHGAKIVPLEPEHFSFGRALNVGCALATGDVLVFASAHVRPPRNDWLEHLTAPFADGTVALCYGRQVGDHRTSFSEHQLLRRWFPAHDDLDQEHPFCNNANCAIRRDLWVDDPYDEELTGLEDIDWANRMLRRGHRIVYRADAQVIHVHEETLPAIVHRYQREAIAHRKIFGDLRMHAFEAIALFVVNTAHDYLTAVMRGRPPSDLWSIPRFRAAQFWGTYRGVNQQGPVTAALKRRFYYPSPVWEGER